MSCLEPIYLRESREHVPCGACPSCLNRRRADWSFRLSYEEQIALNSWFVTFTYNDWKIPIDYDVNGNPVPVLNKQHLINAIKAMRKETKMYGFKYYCIGEYGSKYLRPHYHGILFNIEPEVVANQWRVSEIGDTVKTEAGYTKIGTVTQASIHYVTGYIMDKQKFGYYKKHHQPFSIMSKGLGKGYLVDNTEYHRNNPDGLIVNRGGVKQTIPRYYLLTHYRIKFSELC